MKIERNKHVTLTYVLRLDGETGEIVEETPGENPLKFVFGAGKMLEMFEQKIDGLTAGQDYSFGLSADEAYGEVNPDAIVEIPKNIFEINGKIDENLLVEGNSVPMQDAQGSRLDGLVLEVSDEFVKMDFNHPLAGDSLYFSGKVIDVREATEDELSQACGAGGCGSGGCESGGCGDDESQGGGCGCSCGC